MTHSSGPVHSHHVGGPSRVIQGFFPGGKPRIIHASPAPAAPVRPPAPGSLQPRSALVPPSILPGRPANGALQPATRSGPSPRPILPATRPQPRTLQPAAPVCPQAPQPIVPQRAGSSTVQPQGAHAFALAANFALKPRGSGQPLPEAIQKKMESFFNTSFGMSASISVMKRRRSAPWPSPTAPTSTSLRGSTTPRRPRGSNSSATS
jgi:hypothetical protein